MKNKKYPRKRYHLFKHTVTAPVPAGTTFHIEKNSFTTTEISTSLKFEGQNKTRTTYTIFDYYKEKEINLYIKLFKYIYVVDTNIKEKINFTGISIYEHQDENNLKCIHKTISAHKSQLDKEKIGWAIALRDIFNKDIKEKILLITDAHLSELEKINNRTTTIFEKLYLPENITMMYASSQKSNKNNSVFDFLVNKVDIFINEKYSSIATTSLKEVTQYNCIL